MFVIYYINAAAEERRGKAMAEFFRQNALTVILLAIGLFFMVMTYAAIISSKRSGRHVSGVPFVGGFFVFLAFIVSPWKYLSALCLLDYGIWMLPYSMIVGGRNDKRYDKMLKENGFETANKGDEKLKVCVRSGKEEHEWNYLSNCPYILDGADTVFMICTDKSGSRFLVYDKNIRFSSPTVVPFDDEKAVIEDPEGSTNVRISIENK